MGLIQATTPTAACVMSSITFSLDENGRAAIDGHILTTQWNGAIGMTLRGRRGIHHRHKQIW
jgi:hypothetical protein